MNHPEPPSKPSELIRLALRDLKAVERSKKYVVDMDHWHEPGVNDSDKPVCRVCMAGAVMAQSLEIPANESCFGNAMDVGIQWANRIGALNCLRQGHLSAAADYWHPCGALGDEDRQVSEYNDKDPSAFHHDMEALAAEYEAAGA